MISAIPLAVFSLLAFIIIRSRRKYNNEKEFNDCMSKIVERSSKTNNQEKGFL